MIFKEVFNAVETKLKTIPGIKNIEWYLEQDRKKGGIIQTPCVYVQFKTERPVQISKHHQEIEIEIEIEIEFKLLLYTDWKKSTNEITELNNHFDIEQLIYEEMGCFEQIEIEPIRKDNALLLSSQTYRIKYVNQTSAPVRRTILRENISAEISTSLDLNT